MMKFFFEGRPSDSPLVHGIWRTQSEREGTFMSLAASNWEMVVTKQKGRTQFTVRGPETKAMLAYCPPDAEFFGIQCKLGTFMPHLPFSHLVDGQADLPEAASHAFWFHGAAWEFPEFENADTFVNRLVREGLLVREPVVDAALQGYLNDLSLRSV